MRPALLHSQVIEEALEAWKGSEVTQLGQGVRTSQVASFLICCVGYIETYK